MITETLFSKEGVSANSAQLQLLQTHFPNCFDASGRFLIEKFQLEIAEQTDINREFFEMNWLGKSYAKLLRNLPPETLLSEDKAHNAKPENANSQNLLICGDNLEVLKHLKNAYQNQVKMIYIDPPYNTGSDGFVYQDDRKFTPEQLSSLANISLDEADRILKFTAKGSNSHSAWLTFMYPRLYIARELLKEDGVIFISIDDNEVAQLKLLCDEVFGEGNFVAELPTIMNLKGNNDEFGFAGTHEYTLVYSRNKNDVSLGQLLLEEESLDEWEEDQKGFYKQGANLKSTGVNAPREKRPNLFFPVFVDKTNRVYVTENNEEPQNLVGKVDVLYPITNEQEMSWRWSKNKFQNENEDIIVSRNGDGISLYKKQRPSLGDLPSKKPKTIFYKPEYSSGNGTSQLKKLFNSKLFSNPKPIDLLLDFLQIGSDSDSLILDFFAGSGTTAHAVMQLNAEDNGNRQFILVQIPEKTDEKSEAFKADYKTIFDITKARIEKAAAQIQAENPNASGDFAFKIYQTTENFRQHSDEEFTLEQAILPFVENLTESQYRTLLTTWALNDGTRLTTPILDVQLGNYTAHLCEERLYLMQTGFSSADLLAFIQKLENDEGFNPRRVIVFSENMPSAMQQELNQAIETYSNKKNIALSLIVRN